jgi:hypothetical protein
VTECEQEAATALGGVGRRRTHRAGRGRSRTPSVQPGRRREPAGTARRDTHLAPQHRGSRNRPGALLDAGGECGRDAHPHFHAGRRRGGGED